MSGGMKMVSNMSGDSSTRIEPMPPNILACDSAVLTSFVIPGCYFKTLDEEIAKGAATNLIHDLVRTEGEVY
jgi:hypothetical protein